LPVTVVSGESQDTRTMSVVLLGSQRHSTATSSG
jgi:hypothetical protein